MNLQFCLSWLVTGKSVSEALIFVFCFDIQNNICTEHVLNFISGEFIEQSLVILKVNSYCSPS